MSSLGFTSTREGRPVVRTLPATRVMQAEPLPAPAAVPKKKQSILPVALPVLKIELKNQEIKSAVSKVNGAVKNVTAWLNEPI